MDSYKSIAKTRYGVKNMDKWGIQLSDLAKNIVGKEEIARYK